MINRKAPHLKVIAGKRDELESALARALFGSDQTQIDKIIIRLNQIGQKKPCLKLVDKNI